MRNTSLDARVSFSRVRTQHASTPLATSKNGTQRKSSQQSSINDSSKVQSTTVKIGQLRWNFASHRRTTQTLTPEGDRSKVVPQKYSFTRQSSLTQEPIPRHTQDKDLTSSPISKRAFLGGVSVPRSLSRSIHPLNTQAIRSIKSVKHQEHVKLKRRNQGDLDGCQDPQEGGKEVSGPAESCILNATDILAQQSQQADPLKSSPTQGGEIPTSHSPSKLRRLCNSLIRKRKHQIIHPLQTISHNRQAASNNFCTTAPQAQKGLWLTPQKEAHLEDGQLGHSYTEKDESHFRFGFLNCNGLSLSEVGLTDFFQAAKEFQVDCLGLSETHLDSTKMHVRNSFLEAATSTSGFSNVKCTFAQSDVDFGSERKRGGVLQFSVYNLANRVISSYSDKYGRFVSQTFIGKNDKRVTVIAAYRVVAGIAGPSSASAQQRAMLVTEGRKADPRSVFLIDMLAYILEVQQHGNSVILGLDANETMSKSSSGIKKLAEQCGLINVHAHLYETSPWASHRQGSSQIDFLFGSPDVTECIKRVGVGGFDDVFDSDHRPIFFDLDAVKFFRGVPIDPTDRKSRTFTTKNTKHTHSIRQTISKEWVCRRLSERIAVLTKISQQEASTIRKDRLLEMWEKLDDEIGRVFQAAELALKAPKKRSHKWSPALAKAGAIKRYWRVRLAWVQKGNSGETTLSRSALSLNLQDDGSEDVTILQQRYDSATKHFASMIHRDVQLREDHLNQLQMQMSQTPSKEIKEEIQAIRMLQRTEQAQKIFKKIRNTLRPIRGGTLAKVEIPRDLSDALRDHQSQQSPIHPTTEKVATILQRIVRQKRTAPEEWVTIIDKPTLETSILLFCQQHFQQAASTPFGSGHLADILEGSGLTEAGEQILQGNWKMDSVSPQIPELRAFIRRLAIPEQLRDVPAIDLEVSVDEYSSAIKKWNERTSTSPSGRHLGFYKAILAIPSITTDMCAMFNVVIRCGLVPKRWCKAISILLEKDPGQPSLNRLRIIHLFEADYNLFLKIFWARRLVQRGEDHNQFGESQQGSRKGRKANDAVLLKRLTYDMTRIQRTNLGTFDNDAKSCYDRIINSLAMLTAQRLGMPSTPIATHAGVLASMRYVVKTAFGVSESYIQSFPGSFLFGTGQGSGASPAVWLTLSTLMLDTLRDLVPRGMSYKSPDRTIHVERYSDAFVDDTQNGLTDAHLGNSRSLSTIIQQLNKMAQTWERILSCSGGSLELSKCSYYILYWKWVKGLPELTPNSEFPLDSTIHLTSGTNKTPIAILQREFNAPHKTLGVWMTPTGDETAQMAALRKDANQVATLIATSSLSRTEALLAYQAYWLPSVTYSMSTTTLSTSDLRSIQSQVTSSFLQKLGFNKHFPRSVAFGPYEMGGLALRDLAVEQGISQIMSIMEHVYHRTEVGSLIRISIDTLQMEAGTKGHLLYNTLPSLQYISKCWIWSIREFLRANQLQLQLHSLWNFSTVRVGDVFIMDQFCSSGAFTRKELTNLNAVRMYLQVATLSDITMADGKAVNIHALNATKCPYRYSTLSWIRQPVIAPHQQILWTKAVKQTFLVSSEDPKDTSASARRLRRPLGVWENSGHQQWRYYFNPSMQRLEAPISLSHARAYTRMESTCRYTQYFQKEFQIVPFRFQLCTPADSVVWDPEMSTLTAKFDTRWVESSNEATNQFCDNTVKAYIKSLSPERQRFFAWSRPCGEQGLKTIIGKIREGINKKLLFEIAPDGGLSENGGSFGLVLALGKEELWEMAGPVDGDPTTANSKRSELAGYAASLELLKMLLQWVNVPGTMHTQTWIDSSGAGRHLSNLLNHHCQKRKYPHDPDMISHIQWLWTQLPQVSNKISWVKGHQDSSCSYKDLPRNAQLNVLADKLATAFANKTLSPKITPRKNPLFFPTSAISLIVNGQRNTAYPKEAIRFHINGTRMRQHLQRSRTSWIDTVWNTIDFQGIGMAYQGLPTVQRLKICKAIHGWLPTGYKRNQLDPMALSTCPCCGDSIETQEHVLQCQDPRMRATRYKSMILLRSTIVTTKGSSTAWTVLHKCLVHWAETSQPPSVPSMLRGTRSNCHSALQSAITEQAAIGWHHAFRGYLSTKWIQAQQVEQPKSTVLGLRRQWLKYVIRAIWQSTVTQWSERNRILHSSDHNAGVINDSALDAKIRKLYASKEDFAISDHVLFDVSLDLRLQHTQRKKKLWLALVARYHPTTTARQKGQQPMITQFFRHAKTAVTLESRLDPDTLQDPPNIKQAGNMNRNLDT